MIDDRYFGDTGLISTRMDDKKVHESCKNTKSKKNYILPASLYAHESEVFRPFVGEASSSLSSLLVRLPIYCRLWCHGCTTEIWHSDDVMGCVGSTNYTQSSLNFHNLLLSTYTPHLLLIIL